MAWAADCGGVYAGGEASAWALAWDVRAWGLPGSLPAVSELYRGLVRPLVCHADAVAAELPQATAALEQVPTGPLLLRNRVYGVGAFVSALRARGLCGRCRRNGRQSWRWLRDLAQPFIAGGPAWDTLIESKGNTTIPTQTLRWLQWRTGRASWEGLPKVSEPAQVSIRDVLSLSPGRWKVERRW